MSGGLRIMHHIGEPCKAAASGRSRRLVVQLRASWLALRAGHTDDPCLF